MRLPDALCSEFIGQKLKRSTVMINAEENAPKSFIRRNKY
jgi:hypothetical protein